MSNRRVVFCIGWMLALAPTLAADPYRTGSFKQLARTFYSTRDGLASNDVRALALGRDGTVYAGTPAGIARFDGTKWIRMAGPDSVAALCSAGAGILAAGKGSIWSVKDAKWRAESGSPAAVISFSVEPGGTPWALATSGVYRREGGNWRRVNEIDEEIHGIRSICATGPDDVYLCAETGIYGLIGKRKYWMKVDTVPGGLLSNDVRASAQFGPYLAIATSAGLNLTNGTNGWHSFTGKEGLPILSLTHLAVGPDAVLWMGSDSGLMRYDQGRFTYLASHRWLPDDRITAIAPAPDGSVWVGTPAGISHLSYRTLTLAEKADILQRDLESRNHRFPYVTIMQLKSPGSFEGALQEISDNDGSWTGLYMQAQSFKYAVTKSADAREKAAKSLRALLRMESITGIPGFPARAIAHKDEPGFKAQGLDHDPEWHPSKVEPGWWWKGDTSSDEIDAHYLAWFIFYKIVANDDEKRAIRETCKRVTDHILDHGYYLVDLDGKPTTWGVWAPEKINDDPKWWEEHGLNALEILSHLKVAQHIVGDPRYEKAYRELIEKHHYALNTINTRIPGAVSHDNELAFDAFYPLVQLEKDPVLRSMYLAGIHKLWSYERADENPLFSMMYGGCTGEPCDVENAVRALQEIPMSFMRWKIRNSHRADLVYDSPDSGRASEKILLHPLPWTERPLNKWDTNPKIDGGDDLVEEDQTMWLLPYWMGRYHKIID